MILHRIIDLFCSICPTGRFDVDRIGHMFVMDYMKHFAVDCQKIRGDSEHARKTRLSKYFSPKYCAELGIGFAPPGYYL